MARADTLFQGMKYRLEPDFEGPLLEVPGKLADRMRDRLAGLYDVDVEPLWRELDRLLKVHQAHATEDIVEAENAFDPCERFSEKDVVLITYGDLILSHDRSPLKTLADCAERLFSGLITTVHILPFFPSSSDRGFSVISFEEVDPALGSWDDVAELEDDFKLMFDGVFNHVSSKSYWFQQFLAGNSEFENFFTVFSTREALTDEQIKMILRPRTTPVLTHFMTINGPRWVWTTFSADQIDLNFNNPKVLLKIIEIMLFYVRHGADLLRIDAVTYLWDEPGTSGAHLRQTHEVVKLMRDVLDAVAPHVGLVTETNVPHEDNITYFGDGSDEAQMVYNFALPPLVLHAFHNADASLLSEWAAELEPPSATTAFFNFLDSHDGIGVMGARGILSDAQIDALCRRVEEHGGFISTKTESDGSEVPYELNITWFSALNREGAGEGVDLQLRRFIASRAVALVLRGVPGIYLPSMIGHRNDVEAVIRENSRRAINRTGIDIERLAEITGDQASMPSRIARAYVHLLRVRTAEPAFHPNAAQEVLALDRRLLAVARTAPDDGSRVLCLINVSGEEVAVALDAADVGLAEELVNDLVTGAAVDASRGVIELELAPYAVCWLRGARSFER
ncbi:MAG TPA: sugar phosphorylase [Chondromyces sp.]|nr:sugar phosphorylase [Chondromyces sp.]